MGMSAAMTPKERKQILAGLIEQGATVVRDGNHGTILNLKDGGRFTVPVGTSDHKARLAMRSQVRRLGYHWPLDPTVKIKENPNPMPREIMTVEEDGKQIVIPSSVQRQLETYPLPRESTYRVAEPYLIEFADKTFWTDELTARIGDQPGYRNVTAGIRLASWMLWYAGFRVVDTKVNRNGFSYQWKRDPDAAWPTEFAIEKPLEAINEARRRLREEAAVVEPTPEAASPAGGTGDDDDTELSLALEQEQRANRAERLAETRGLDLQDEKVKHASTRRTLMVRIAGLESTVVSRDAEISRLRSLIEEERARLSEQDAALNERATLRRAKVAEDQVKSLTDDVADLKARLRSAEDATNEARIQLRTSEPRVVSTLGDWWPIEPSAGQTVEELIAAGPMFGLEVRLQARRK